MGRSDAPRTGGAVLQERRAAGHSRRRHLPRREQSRVRAATERPDPVAVLRRANVSRIPELVALKTYRMAASPFAFFRGAAALMADDLAALPVSGLGCQMCGDAHVKNLGAYAAPDGHLVFDLNDFDETLPGPWEWDLKRLAVSLVLAGREAGARSSSVRDGVLRLVRAYRQTLDRLSGLAMLDLVKVEIRHRLDTGVLHEVLARAERVTSAYALDKLTVRRAGGARRFHDRPPLLHHVPARVARAVVASLRCYRDTLGPDRQLAFDAYRPVDVAFKVVGTGSVGTRDYVVLLLGRGPDDPLLLQVKEALPSCYARFLPAAATVEHQGRRVAEGQHRMQSATDPLLGWTRVEGRDFIVRQLADHKAALEPTELGDAALPSYARVCGEILAKGHARTGDAAAIAGYCGRGDALDRAIAKFAFAYADLTERDHARFVAAIRAGQLSAESELRLRRISRQSPASSKPGGTRPRLVAVARTRKRPAEA